MAARERDEVGGQRVDRYRIEELIGQGRLGPVYRAFDPELSLPVALRLLPAWIARDPAAIDQFQALGQRLVSLRHPSVLPALRFGIDEGRPFVASRLVNAGSLDEWLTRIGSPLDPLVATWLISAIAPGLDAAHGQGIVHGTLGAASVLLDDQRGPYLADFGLGRIGWRPDSGQPDDPDVIAPEEIGRETIGPASDRWALATLLYRLVTGRSPADAAAATGGVIPSALTLNPSLPADLDQVFSRALDSDPGRRYSTAVGFADALWLAVGGRPPSLVPGIGLRGAAAALPVLAALIAAGHSAPLPIQSPVANEEAIPPTLMMAPTLRESATPAGITTEPVVEASAVAPAGIPATVSPEERRSASGRRGLLVAVGLVALVLGCGGLVWVVQAFSLTGSGSPVAGTLTTVTPTATSRPATVPTNPPAILPTASPQPTATAIPATPTPTATAPTGLEDGKPPTGERPAAPPAGSSGSPTSPPGPASAPPPFGPLPLNPTATPPPLAPPPGAPPLAPTASGPVIIPGLIGPGLFVPTNTPVPPTPTPIGEDEPRRPRPLHDPHHPIPLS